MRNAFLLLVLAASCGGPGDGDLCNAKTDETHCSGGDSELMCDGTYWIEVACNGKHGCQTDDARKAVCDISYKEGDACTGGERCSPDDPNVVLRCVRNIWVAATCNNCMSIDSCGE